MITVSDREKYVCVWGNPEHVDMDMIEKYKAKGYTIVRVSNGTGNIRDCLGKVIKSSGLI